MMKLMKRLLSTHSLTWIHGTFSLFLAAGALSAPLPENEEKEGTRAQVESADNVAILVTNCPSFDGDEHLIVFDRDNLEEQFEVSIKVKFHPIPEKEYILRERVYDWRADEGFSVVPRDNPRPKVKASPQAIGKEGQLRLNLQWEEEQVDKNKQPTGKKKIHPWKSSARMRLLVPVIDIQAVSYNLGDRGANGALPFYDNGDPDVTGEAKKPRLIASPEYRKGDTRSSDQVGVLYKKGMTPKMKVQFACRPATAGKIDLYAEETGGSLVPSAQSEEGGKVSGSEAEALVTCTAPLPRRIESGVAKHLWHWSVYGRALHTDKNKKDTTTRVENVFVVLDVPKYKVQPPWINCMKYGITKLEAANSVSSKTVLNKIVPNFRNNTYYPEEKHGVRQLSYDEEDQYCYKSFDNISRLYEGKTPTNCFDAAVSTFAVTQYLGCVSNSISQKIAVLIKKPWWRASMEGDNEDAVITDDNFDNWTSTIHTYLLLAKRYVYDPTPAWADTPVNNGPAQMGVYTQGQFFEYMNERFGRKSRWGQDCTPTISW